MAVFLHQKAESSDEEEEDRALMKPGASSVKEDKEREAILKKVYFTLVNTVSSDIFVLPAFCFVNMTVSVGSVWLYKTF